MVVVSPLVVLIKCSVPFCASTRMPFSLLPSLRITPPPFSPVLASFMFVTLCDETFAEKFGKFGKRNPSVV